MKTYLICTKQFAQKIISRGIQASGYFRKKLLQHKKTVALITALTLGAGALLYYCGAATGEVSLPTDSDIFSEVTAFTSDIIDFCCKNPFGGSIDITDNGIIYQDCDDINFDYSVCNTPEDLWPFDLTINK